jgi:Concanavalin A-like lectin/glucanases superfamily
MARLSTGLVAALAALLVCAGSSQAATLRGATYVVGTYDGSTLRLYVDGSLVAQQSSSLPVNTGSAPVELGSFLGGESWYGTLDDVAVYRRALDVDSLRRHYKVGTGAAPGDYGRAIQATKGLAAYWRLDDSSAKTAADALGSHPGVYRPGTALRVPGLLARDPNRAAAFDGGQGDVVVGNGSDLSLEHGFTLEAWAAAGARRDQTLMAKASSWFMKTNASGQWGAGFLSGKQIVSIYSKQPATVAPAPIALAAPAPKPATQPATTTSGGGKHSSGTSTALISWIAILAAGTVVWFVFRTRRRHAAAQSASADRDRTEAGPG